MGAGLPPTHCLNRCNQNGVGRSVAWAPWMNDLLDLDDQHFMRYHILYSLRLVASRGSNAFDMMQASSGSAIDKRAIQ